MFKKRARNFYCLRQHYGICFNIQSSLYNSQEEIRFTFNVGIFIPPAYEVFYGPPLPVFPKEYDCLVRNRIGCLMNGKDKWYSLTDCSSIEVTKNEIHSDLNNYFIPFIKDIGTAKDVIEREVFKLRKNPNSGDGVYRLQVATAAIKVGGIEDGVKIIKREYANSDNDSFKKLTRNIAEKLGVELIVEGA